MLEISPSDLTIYGVLGLIIIAFIIVGLLKGFIRMTFGLVALSAGAWAGLWGFQNGLSWAGVLIDEPDQWMAGAVGLIIGFAAFFVSRALFGIILTPSKPKEGAKRKFTPSGGILGFLMGIAFTWFCLSGIRYAGTLYELDWVRTALSSKEWLNASTPEDRFSKQPAQPALSKLKRQLDANLAGQFHEKFDLINNRARANLSKLTLLVDNERVWTRANLKADVRAAAKQAQINYLLTEQKAQLKALYSQGKTAQLLHSDSVKEVCAEENARSKLADLDIEAAIGLLPGQENN
tara:strand:+ start:898 stop:1773 length:876 start_codon:yes stop_codon:yes gene_type:complete